MGGLDALGEELPLLEGIRTTRSIRRLKPDPVDPALIRKVCEAGTFAPSGGNRQPWVFVAVMEPERRAWIAERYADAFSAYFANAQRAMDAAPNFPEAKKRNLRSARHLAAVRSSPKPSRCSQRAAPGSSGGNRRAGRRSTGRSRSRPTGPSP